MPLDVSRPCYPLDILCLCAVVVALVVAIVVVVVVAVVVAAVVAVVVAVVVVVVFANLLKHCTHGYGVVVVCGALRKASGCGCTIASYDSGLLLE
jgi:uncharacterized membrane protein YoaK (UPF0700 family)